MLLRSKRLMNLSRWFKSMVTTLTQDVYAYIEQHTPIERYVVIKFFIGYDIESIIDTIDYLFNQELININGTLLTINKGV